VGRHSLLVLLVLAGTAVAPGAPAGELAPVAIVIDDLGNRRSDDLRALELPGPLTYAFLPHTPHAASLARIAHSLGKQVLVHLPMEALSRRALGPGGLTAALARHQFERRIHAALDAVPHASGVSNHMGSLLTTMPQPMDWLMQVLAGRGGWLFLDSRTTTETVAERRAIAAGVATTRRDVFLDNEPTPEAIHAQLDRLLSKARRHGTAVAIGHPHPETVAVLARELPRLRRRGGRLAPLSEVVAIRAAGEPRITQGSSPGQAASTMHTPRAPRAQLSRGAPATIIGWNPSSP
jgi:polysaccharide deacetylase 2 family uncharacterized protein YibQ